MRLQLSGAAWTGLFSCGLACFKRPSDGAILLTVWRPARFGEVAGALGHGIGCRWSITMSWRNGREVVLIEAGNELDDRIAGAAAGGAARATLQVWSVVTARRDLAQAT